MQSLKLPKESFTLTILDFMVSGIDTVTLIVSDLDKSVEFYSDLEGWDLIARYPITTPARVQLWGKQKNMAAGALFQNRISSAGRIELVAFEDSSHTRTTGRRLPWEIGIFDINLLVRDIYGRFEELCRKGAAGVSSGPVHYTVAGLEIAEVLLYGLSGEVIGLLEVKSAQPINGLTAPETGYSEVTTSAQVVKSMERSLAFYRDVVGLNLWMKSSVQSPEMDRMLSLPDGTKFDMAILTAGESLSGKVELIEFNNLEGEEARVGAPDKTGFLSVV